MLLLSGAAALVAQRAITGKVTDEKGEALIGASVLVKGTTTGTVTDLDGTFRLQIPPGSNALIVSYTGCLTKEVALTTANNYDISLATDVVAISEVVVVGYSTQQKRDITGNIASIKGSDIANLAVQSFDQALQGRAAVASTRSIRKASWATRPSLLKTLAASPGCSAIRPTTRTT